MQFIEIQAPKQGRQGFQTCKWTVQVGQATSLIRLPDPSDFDPGQTIKMTALH